MNTLSTSCEQIMNNFSRADCSQTGFINKPISSQIACAPARVKKKQSIKNPDAYYRQLRINKYGADIDPVRRVVDEAVALFSHYKSEEEQESDRSLWLKIANRVGDSAFGAAIAQKLSEDRNDLPAGKRLREPAAAFQQLLNKRFPRPTGTSKRKGGAK